MASLSDQHLYQVISKGGASVGKSPMMAPWGGVINEQGIKRPDRVPPQALEQLTQAASDVRRNSWGESPVQLRNARVKLPASV